MHVAPQIFSGGTRGGRGGRGGGLVLRVVLLHP